MTFWDFPTVIRKIKRWQLFLGHSVEALKSLLYIYCQLGLLGTFFTYLVRYLLAHLQMYNCTLCYYRCPRWL